jgi:hypothetical protein
MGDQTSSFVPSGVDAGTWMGFEQRIRSRRFAALVDQFEHAVLNEDRDLAEAALDEARELRPDAPEIRAAADRLAVLQATPVTIPEAHAWSRVIGAVSLLLIGVSLLVGLDWMRMSPPAPAAPPAVSARSLDTLNIPEVVVVHPEPLPEARSEPLPQAVPEPLRRPSPAALASSAPVASPVTSPAASHSPTRWNKVLKLFGVEVITGTPTAGVRVRRAI